MNGRKVYFKHHWCHFSRPSPPGKDYILIYFDVMTFRIQTIQQRFLRKYKKTNNVEFFVVRSDGLLMRPAADRCVLEDRMIDQKCVCVCVSQSFIPGCWSNQPWLFESTLMTLERKKQFDVFQRGIFHTLTVFLFEFTFEGHDRTDHQRNDAQYHQSLDEKQRIDESEEKSTLTLLFSRSDPLGVKCRVMIAGRM